MTLAPLALTMQYYYAKQNQSTQKCELGATKRDLTATHPRPQKRDRRHKTHLAPQNATGA
jgi:hypothetical protein